MNLFDFYQQSAAVPNFSQEELWFLAEKEESVMEYMDYISEVESENVHLFPFCREKSDGTFYLDVYAYDPAIGESFRFIIAPEHKLTDEQEDKFLELVRSNCSKVHYTKDKLIEYVGEKIPQFKIEEDIKGKVFLERCYYVSHRNGIKELLYKIPELSNIAFHLEDMEGVNITGTNVEEIFGLSLNCLKLFSKGTPCDYITKEWGRFFVAEAYKEYHNILNSQKYISEYQWRYLYDLKNPTLFDAIPEKFDIQLFKTMAYVTSENEYLKYLEYYALQDELTGYVERKTVKNHDELISRLRKLVDIQEILWRDDMYDRAFKKQYERFQHLQIIEENFKVRIAQSVKEFINFADPLNNCLISERYFERIRKGETLILFIEDLNNNEKIAVELSIEETGIEHDCDVLDVNEALRACNKGLKKEQLLWLKEYCKKNVINFDLRRLLGEYIDDDYGQGVDDDVYELYYNGEIDEE